MARMLRLLTVVLAVLLAACSSEIDAPDAFGDPSLVTAYGEDWPASPPGGGGRGGGAAGSATALSGDADVATDDARDTTTLDRAESPVREVEASLEAPAGLRGGSVNDNDRFVDYLAYRERFLATGVRVHDRDVSERHVVRVTDPAGRPVLGARVALLADGRELQAFRTRPDGRALLHPLLTGAPAASAFEIRVEHGDAVAVVAVEDRAAREHAITLDAAPREGRTRLDVHFLIDATGSMGDEIDRLKSTMTQVAARVSALESAPDVRWGMTAYRDRGDAFVVRSFDFTADLATFTAELAKLEADGGGDEPEALNEALHAAVHGPAWDPGDAVRIMFLIADAPPHLDYPDDHDYADEMLLAAAKGIALVPIASSGTDDQAEYIFRQLAQTTLGRFLFLTYGADGAPGDSTTHDVGGYEAMSLDELVVRYVAEQLAHLESRPGQQ